MGQRERTAWEPAANVLDLSVTPAVDRLLRVTNDGHVAEVVGGQHADEVQLDAVGVLELIDQQVAEALAAARSKLGHPAESVDHVEDEVVEVTQPAGPQRVLVRLVNEGQHLDRLELGE